MNHSQQVAKDNGKFLVTNIQRFSVNDGPGIRSTVFLKGCPLSCAWCHNPENINPYQEFYHNTEKCVRCGACADVCPEGAITPPVKRETKKEPEMAVACCTTPESSAARAVPEEISETEPPQIDREKCTHCMKCVEACKYEALTLVSTLMTVDEVYEEVKRDEMFYQSSGGGMTLSGGEPLMNPEVTLELFKRAKADGIHTALDTTGFAKWEIIEGILDYVDIVLYDIKIIDEEKHKKWTGVSNKLILENARKMAKRGTNMRIRSLVVHNVNYWDPGHAKGVMAFAKSLGESVKGVDILPFHNFAEGKYDQLGRKNVFKGFPNLFQEDIEAYEKIITEGNTWKTTVGGMIGVEQDAA
ncbi:glycyl-radical enzyme activating protein [Desulfonema magnum]|uniref:Hydroxybenzylsuccinate synthase activating enzyme n=1 Tax=Desulfonema magnum TaxID=45655 RepID=A0A975BX96_9BACT|nr:glycyl-radical enzyme activating protein [Desulfonema magnum]QTA92875.1 Hydroxybenzylsuccinate synthase activating enzyme [Desulfonema magnum]